jgi:hypothetical protein
MEKEIIIKNYRLRVIDALKDISEQDRQLMHLNKGTSIYVANSLLKPEIYRYSTKVTNTFSEIFLDMVNRLSKNKPARQTTEQHYDSNSSEDELDLVPENDD